MQQISVCWSCILLSCWIHLLVLMVFVLRQKPGEMTKQVSSTDSSSLALCFPVWTPFTTFPHLIAVGRISSTVWSRSGESGHPCLVLQLAGRLSAFHLWVLCWLWIQCKLLFIMLRYVLFIPTLVRFCFYHEWVLNFVRYLFCIYWEDLVGFFF